MSSIYNNRVLLKIKNNSFFIFMFTDCAYILCGDYNNSFSDKLPQI